MTHKSYRGEILDRATSSESLQRRLKHNTNFSVRDFFTWHQKRLGVKAGMDVLDVGCGTGAQSIPISQAVGPRGSVSAVDLSEESVQTLLGKVQGENVEAVASDMAHLQDVIDNRFSAKAYDLAQSSYAIYYADDPLTVMDVMRGALKPEGRLAIFVPDTPHGMVDLAAEFTQVPAQVIESINFGRKVLEPYFRKHFWNVTVHLFHNEVCLPDCDTFMDMYRATTYYDVAAEAGLRERVQREIDQCGTFCFEKNGYLIIGDDAR